jgi:hypothetical protein
MRKPDFHTSLIGTVVTGIAVGVVEKERSQKRLHAKHFLSMMSIREVSHLFGTGNIILGGNSLAHLDRPWMQRIIDRSIRITKLALLLICRLRHTSGGRSDYFAMETVFGRMSLMELRFLAAAGLPAGAAASGLTTCLSADPC